MAFESLRLSHSARPRFEALEARVAPAVFVAARASVSATVVTGTEVGVSVRGAYAGDESRLTYTWSVLLPPTSAPPPEFTVNGTNAAKTSTLRFFGIDESSADGGVFTLRATIRDPQGNVATSDVTVRVARSLTALSLGPANVSVRSYGTWRFVASGTDQFGRAWNANLPPVAWTLKGPGTLVGADGLTRAATYTAPATRTSVVVSAQAAGITGSAILTIGKPTLTFTVPPGPTVSYLGRVALAGSVKGVPVYATSQTQVRLGIPDEDIGLGAGDPTRTIQWTTVSGPAGSAVTYQSQGATSASASFSGPGLYRVRATLRNSTGQSATSDFYLDVNPSPQVTRLAVTPEVTALRPGEVVPLTLQAFDQFGFRMPGRTYTGGVLSYPVPAEWLANAQWSATGAGSVSADGVLTAAATPGTVTVTATAGGRSISLTLTVSGSSAAAWVAQNLSAPGVASRVSAAITDGVFSRTDAIALFRGLANDLGPNGRVTASQVDDLRRVAGAGRLLGMSEAVQGLTRQLVSGDVENVFAHGIVPLGAFGVGTTATQLGRLTDKWFLGQDRPYLPLGYEVYAPSSLPLWGPGGPKAADVKQDPNLGDCHLLAALAGLADRSPDAIRDLFRDNGDGTYTVRLYRTDGPWSIAGGRPYFVTVDRFMPTRTGTVAVGSALWVGLLEKALIQLNGAGVMYTMSQPGGNTFGDSYLGFGALEPLTGRSPSLATPGLSWAGFTDAALQARLVAGEVVLTNTSVNTAVPANGLRVGHYYAILGYDPGSKLYALFNPFGSIVYKPWSVVKACFMGTESVALAVGSHANIPHGPSWAPDNIAFVDDIRVVPVAPVATLAGAIAADNSFDVYLTSSFQDSR